MIVQVAAGTTLLLTCRRDRPPGALAPAGSTYVLGSVVIAAVPAAAACLAGAPALALARWWLGTRREHHPAARTTFAPPGPATLTIRAGVAWLAAAVLVTAAGTLGPGMAGAVGAFPALTTTLAVMVWRRHGTVALEDVTGGLIRALPVYLTFCAAFTAAAQKVLPTHLDLVPGTTVAVPVLAWVLRDARPEREAPRTNSSDAETSPSPCASLRGDLRVDPDAFRRDWAQDQILRATEEVDVVQRIPARPS